VVNFSLPPEPSGVRRNPLPVALPQSESAPHDDGPYLPYFVIQRTGRFAPLICSDRQGLALAALTGRRRSVRLLADGWQREFDEPIETPDGTQLRTLREAVVYLATAVPKSERDLPAVTTAAEMLTYAPEGGTAWMFLARMVVSKALHRGSSTRTLSNITGESGS
jgi:hypothetical protein